MRLRPPDRIRIDRVRLTIDDSVLKDGEVNLSLSRLRDVLLVEDISRGFVTRVRVEDLMAAIGRLTQE